MYITNITSPAGSCLAGLVVWRSTAVVVQAATLSIKRKAGSMFLMTLIYAEIVITAFSG